MIGTRLCQRYELVAELGRGGMGVVYRATDPVLEREVAVKVIAVDEADTTREERFRREARLVAKLDHPAIVPIFDFGRHRDSLFFVMPLLDGDTLAELLRERSLHLGEVLEILERVAEALDHSASRDVIHRDVKPENVMVTRARDGEPRVRVMDFGLAWTAAPGRLTEPDQLPGTLPYLSPEQVLSLEVDGRSDLYSLGTILYQCLAGEPPFKGSSKASVLYKIVHEAPPSLGHPGVGEELEGIVLRCLEKEPGDRLQRGRDLAAALRQCRRGLGEAADLAIPLSEPSDGLNARLRKQALPLVGRRAELSELDERLAAAVAGECQLVLIGGEAGSGKTRLLEELERRCRHRRIRVLHGRFPDQEGIFPHHGFCELVEDYFRTQPAGRLSSAVGGAAAGDAVARDAVRSVPDLGDLAVDLRALFPALGEIPAVRDAAVRDAAVRDAAVRDAAAGGHELRAAEAASKPAADGVQVFELLARTLIRLAAGEPLVLMLENLHAAGASTEALEYVVRRLGPTPTLIVGSFRSDEAPKQHPLSRSIRRFAGDPRFQLVILGPLSRDETRELVGSRLGGDRVHDPRMIDDLAARLFAAADGHPLFTCELLRSVIESGDLESSDTGSGTGGYLHLSDPMIVAGRLPDTIQHAVEARLERLPEELSKILAVASVLGRDFEVDELAELIADPEAAEEAVDRLIDEGLLEEDRRSRGARVHFASGLVRDVLHDNLTRRRRRRLHRLYAELIERRNQGRLERVYPRLVYHFSQADEPVKTVTYALMLARMSAGAVAPVDTIRATRVALEFIEDHDLDSGGEVEGELRLMLASASRWVGNVEGALREAAKAATALERSGELKAAAEAALIAAETAWQLRKVDDNRRWLRRAIDLARTGDAGSVLRQALTFAATVSNLRGERGRARELLDEVERLARGEARNDQAPTGGVLRTALLSALTTGDPAAVISVEDAEVLGCVFEPLLGSDADGNPVPRLAVEWTPDAEGRSWELRLRDGVRFSDGSAVTAAAVKSSFEGAVRRARERAGGAPGGSWPGSSAAALRVIDGAGAVLAGTADEIHGIRVDGDRRLHMKLTGPLPMFPSLLTDLRTAVVRETPPGDGGSEPRLLGSGPFRIATRDAERVVLERNPASWQQPPPRLDGIELVYAADSAGLAASLLAGELDVGRELLPGDLDEVSRAPEFRQGLIDAPKKNVYFVLFNGHGPMAQHAVVRRAVSGVVRAQDVVWRTLGRFAQPATCLIPPGILGHDAGRSRPAMSRDQAADLLRGAGIPLPVRLRAAVHPFFHDRYRSLLEALSAEWSAIGCEISVETSDLESYVERWQDNLEVDLLIGRWVPDYDDPDNLTYATFHSRQGAFRRYFCSPELDRLLERARHTPHSDRRQKLYRQVESHLDREAVLLPLFHEMDYRIVSPRIVGLRHLPNPPYVNYGEVAKVADRGERRVRARLPGSSLRIPLPTTFDSLEPALALYVEPAEVVPNVFETLTCVEEGARIAPCLASRFSVEDGGRRIRFELRPGVRFHDGRPLTSRDVRYSFQRLLKLPYPGVEAALLPLRGARAFRAGTAAELAGFEILSARGFVLELEEPVSFFPAMLTNPMTAIVAEGVEHFDRSWRQGCVGTGPFRLIRCEPGRRIDLEAHPGYWRRGRPRCRRLVFELGVAPERVAVEFRSGRFAIATSLPPADAEALRQEPEYAVGLQESPAFATYFLLLNARRGPFSDIEVRRALCEHLDCEEVVRATLGRLAVPAPGLVSPGLLGYEPGGGRAAPAAGVEAAPATSLERLIGLELRASVHPVYMRQYRYVWDALAVAFSNLGVDLEAASRLMPEVLQEIQTGEVDFVAARRIAAYPDTDAMVNLLHSRDGLLGAIVGDGRIDRWIEHGRAETDPGLRHAIYRQLEDHLRREALLVPLFDEQIQCFARPEIRGLRLRLGWPRIAYEELSRDD